MQTRAALITFALAASASALAPPAGPAVTPAPLMLLRRDWEAPEDFDAATDCALALTHLQNNLPPTPTGALASWFDSVNSLSDVEEDIAEGKRISDVASACSALMTTPAPPSSLASSFSSYESDWSSWLSGMAPDASSIAAMCTGDSAVGLIGAAMELIAATDVPQCTAAVNKYNSNSIVSGASTAGPAYVAAVAGAAGLAAAFALF